jgi:Sec-independent protein translocase protein TatA
MFNIPEMLFIFVLALLLIGPKQLPEVARTIGRFLNEMKRASEGIFAEMKKPQNTVNNHVRDLKKDIYETDAEKATRLAKLKSTDEKPT